MIVPREKMSLPGGKDFFSHIAKPDNFEKFVRDGYEAEASQVAALGLSFSDTEVGEAHRCYLSGIAHAGKEIAHAEKEMKPSSPSHFTHAGFIVYWLSRFNPVSLDIGKYRPSGEERKVRDFLQSYGHVALAFALGFRICHNFERGKGDDTPLPFPDEDYVNGACYLMKYKSIPPHAIGFIYRSLFFKCK